MILPDASRGAITATAPNSPVGDTDEMHSLHPGGANFLLCDGSVRFIKESIQLSTWAALSSRCGGEIISSDY
jgi:prepilin-type processing-associated H-X9-DG protein